MPESTSEIIKSWKCAECGGEYRAHYPHGGRCHSCRRYLKLYGLSRADHDRLLADFRENGCPICGDKTARPVIDHLHGSQVVRGMLCDQCNRGLGHFRDSEAIIRRALLYLRHYSGAKAKAHRVAAAVALSGNRPPG